MRISANPIKKNYPLKSQIEELKTILSSEEILQIFFVAKVANLNNLPGTSAGERIGICF